MNKTFKTLCFYFLTYALTARRRWGQRRTLFRDAHIKEAVEKNSYFQSVFDRKSKRKYGKVLWWNPSGVGISGSHGLVAILLPFRRRQQGRFTTPTARRTAALLVWHHHDPIKCILIVGCHKSTYVLPASANLNFK